MIVEVERQERYWYPDDGGEVWVAGFQLVGADGRFLGRDELSGRREGHARRGRVPRPEALASELAAPGAVSRCCGRSPTTRTTRRRSPWTSHDGTPAGYVPREYTADVVGWSALVLRERAPLARASRANGLTMLLTREPAELHVR